MVIWLTGYSSSGKSTLGMALYQHFSNKGLIKLLDGDEIRAGLNSDLGFSIKDRKENIRRVAHLAKLFHTDGYLVICCFISPTEEIRSMAREIINAKNYYEVFVDAPIEVCEKRDVKGLYQKARSGELINFTGIDSLFEKPNGPNLVLNTHLQTLNESTELLIEKIEPLIKHKNH
ncbi:MAG: adenylylsulfate kinase [Arenicella sp.]|jgi:adenylylsulfate kinase